MVAFARHPLQSKPLAYAISTAKFEAFRFVRLGALPKGEQEDAAQDILVAVLQRWPGYSSDRGAPATFLSVVARRSAASLARARTAKKRGGGRAFLTLDFHELDAESLQSRRHVSGDNEFVESRLDVQHVVARLPRDLRRVALALMTMRPTTAARHLRMAPRTMTSKIAAIRSHFIAAGLEP